MSLKVTHKHSTAAGTPPAAGDLDVGELAINAADAEIYTKDSAGNIKKFANTDTTDAYGIANGVQFTQAGTGAVQRTVESKLQETVSVLDFIPPGTNTETTDCAVYLQAALDWLTAYTSTESGFSRGGRALYFPAGNYLTNSTLTIAPKASVTIYGDGPASMILGGNGLDAPIMVVGDANKLSVGVKISDLGFASGELNTTNSVCLVLRRHYNAVIENCTFDRAHTSIVFYAVGHSYIRGCELGRRGHTNAGGVKTGYGLVLDDDGADYGSGAGDGGSFGIHIDDCEFWGGGDNPDNFIKACILVRDIDGLYINNTHIYNAEHAIWVDPDGINRNTLTTIQVVNSYLDTCTGPHLLVSGQVRQAGNGNKVFGDFLFSNTYFRHSTNNHVKFDIDSASDFPLRNILFADSLFSDCSSESILNATFDGGKIDGYKISDCTFDGCAKAGGLAVIQDFLMGDVAIGGCRFIDTANRMVAPALACLYMNTDLGADLSIGENEYLIETTLEEPAYFGPFKTTMRSFELSARKSTLGGVATIDRTYDAVVPASGNALLAVIDVNFNFAGVCEYTIIGNDQNGAGLGHHAAHGYFSFRRPPTGNTAFYNSTVAFEHKEGTLATNTVTIGSFDPNVHIRIDNTLSNECRYTAICRIVQRFVET